MSRKDKVRYSLNDKVSPLISVVICTYDRAQLLRNVLETLFNQTLDLCDYEIIVIENSSNRESQVITDDYNRRFSTIRYIVETQIGLSYARNSGWQNARGEYIAYIDDDCEAPPGWLTVAKEVIEHKSPGIFGGPGFALYNTPKPLWFRDAYESRQLGNVARELAQNEYLFGFNIFFHRGLLESLGGFDATLGMSGKQIAYGEEVAVQNRARAIMPKKLIFYEPRLHVKHLVRHEKMKMRWLIPAFLAKGRYVYLAKNNIEQVSINRPKLLMEIIKTVSALAVDLAAATVKRDRTKYAYIQNYFYEHTSQYLRRLGRLCTQYQQIGHISKAHQG